MIKMLFPALLLITGILHLYSCLKEREKIRMVSKPFLMPLLAVCWMLFAKQASYLVLFGILLGGLGDIALLWPLKRKPFLFGLLFFFLGHLCYLSYIFITYEISAGIIWPIIIAIIYLTGSTFIYVKTRSELPPVFRIPSFMYMLALSALSACTLLVLITAPGIGKAVAFVGATLFLISDGILSQMLFIKKKETPILNFIVMLTYIGAQILLALGWALG